MAFSTSVPTWSFSFSSVFELALIGTPLTVYLGSIKFDRRLLGISPEGSPNSPSLPITTRVKTSPSRRNHTFWLEPLGTPKYHTPFRNSDVSSSFSTLTISFGKISSGTSSSNVDFNILNIDESLSASLPSIHAGRSPLIGSVMRTNILTFSAMKFLFFTGIVPTIFPFGSSISMSLILSESLAYTIPFLGLMFIPVSRLNGLVLLTSHSTHLLAYRG